MGAVSVYGQIVSDAYGNEMYNAIVNDRINHNFNMYTGTIGMVHDIKKVRLDGSGDNIGFNESALIKCYENIIKNNENTSNNNIFNKFFDTVFSKDICIHDTDELNLFIDNSKPVGYKITEPKLIRKEIGFNYINPYTLENVKSILWDPNTLLLNEKGRCNKEKVLQQGKGYIALKSSIYTDYKNTESCLYTEKNGEGFLTSWGIRVFSTLEELENCERFIHDVQSEGVVYYIIKLSGDKLYSVTAKTTRKMGSTLTREEITKYKSKKCRVDKLYNAAYFGMVSI